MKKGTGFFLAVTMGMFIIFPANVNGNGLEEEQNEIQAEREEVQQKLTAAEEELAEVLDEIDELTKQIHIVEEAVRDNEKTMNETELEIDEQELEIERLESEIDRLEDDIQKRFELLKSRANSYHKSGGNVRFLEVILGSESFSDFLGRVFTVTRIAQADNEIIEQLEENQRTVEEHKSDLLNKLDDLVGLYEEMEGMEKHLKGQLEQNETLKNELEAKEAEVNTKLEDLAALDESLEEDEAAIQERIEAARSERQSNSGNSNSQASDSSRTSNSSQASGSTTPSTVSNSGGSLEVTRVGQKYIGNSTYVFGGGRSSYDVANGRFDCSGFVAWSYAQVGVSLPYSTDGLVNSGRRVPVSDMRAGDLVFFDTYKRDGHVGIYMGNGRFIGSQSSTGVAIANMNSGYWANTFNGKVVRVR